MNVKTDKVYLVFKEMAYGKQFLQAFSTIDMAKDYVKSLNNKWLSIVAHDIITEVEPSTMYEKLYGPEYNKLEPKSSIINFEDIIKGKV